MQRAVSRPIATSRALVYSRLMAKPNTPPKDTVTVAAPSQMKTVLIAPLAPTPTPYLKYKGARSVFQQNWAFAQQWKSKSPGDRVVLTIALNAPISAFVQAVKQAAAIAQGREVVLFVGHGGSADYRGLTETVFDSVPETSHGLSTHLHTIKADVFRVPIIAKKINGKWTAQPYKNDPKDTVSTTESQATVDALAPRYDALLEISAELRKNKVGAFVILACNVALDAKFLGKLQSILGIPVVGYSGLVAIAETIFYSDPKNTVVDQILEQIWISSDGSAGQPSVDDANDPTFYEIPTNKRVRVP